jgi:hypothetical protein
MVKQLEETDSQVSKFTVENVSLRHEKTVARKKFSPRNVGRRTIGKDVYPRSIEL